jgi:outer membrane immunogenic protein
MTTRRSKFRVAVVLPALACAAAENARGEEMIAPPAFTWRGFHVGASFGGGLAPRPGAMGFRNGLGSLPDALWSLPGGGGGVLGGVQAGYDYAFGPLVLGVEADWQAAGLGGGSRAIGGGAEPLAFLATRSAIDWFGTLRGRVGYSVLPRLLVYGSGGLAYGGGGDLLTYSDAEGREAESVKNTTRLGFSVGGGFEWAFRPAWSVRLDYLYVDLGRGPGHVARLESEEEEEGPPVFVTLAGAPKRFHALRASLNYRFNFLGGAEVDARPDEKFASEGEKAPEISTHYLFGFTYGTDIETEGKGEILSITRMDFGKRAALPALEPEESPRLWPGSSFYRATLQTLEFEHTLTDRLQYALGVIGANHNIRGVRGIEDIQNTSLKGLLGEVRYILLKRGVDAPIGVALHVEPRWGGASGITGAAETSVESDTRLMVDAALVPGKLFAAANVIYQPQLLREPGEKWLRRSYFGAFGGFSYFLNPKVALGGGLQYLQSYSGGFWLDKFEGDALYAGPQIYVRLTDRLFLTASFSQQVAGHSIVDPQPLDLINFSRSSARIQFGGEF